MQQLADMLAVVAWAVDTARRIPGWRVHGWHDWWCPDHLQPLQDCLGCDPARVRFMVRDWAKVFARVLADRGPERWDLDRRVNRWPAW